MIIILEQKVFNKWFKKNSLYPIILILLTSPLVFPQSNTTHIVKPDKLNSIHSIGILPIDFDYFYLTAGGIREYNDSNSIATRAMIMDKVQNIISENKFSVSTLSSDAQNMSIRRFYNVVNSEIMLNVFSPSPFPNAKKYFSYSLPHIEELCNHFDIDALLLINGFDDCSTKRRKKLKAGAVAGAIAGAIMAALTGVGGYTIIPPDLTILSCGLVNRSGEIIWYNSLRKTGKIDMSEKKDVDKLVTTLLNRFRKETK